jgi:hypothetical protein
MDMDELNAMIRRHQKEKKDQEGFESAMRNTVGLTESRIGAHGNLVEVVVKERRGIRYITEEREYDAPFGTPKSCLPLPKRVRSYRDLGNMHDDDNKIFNFD